MARASAVAAERGAVAAWRSKADSEMARIKDSEDRQIIEQDLATLP